MHHFRNCNFLHNDFVGNITHVFSITNSNSNSNSPLYKKITKVARWILAYNWAQKYFCAQSETRIRMSCRTASLSVAFQGFFRPFLKLSPPFFLTRLTALGSQMMGHPRTPGMELICILPRPHLLGLR